MGSLELLSYFWSLNTVVFVKIENFDFDVLRYHPIFNKLGSFEVALAWNSNWPTHLVHISIFVRFCSDFFQFKCRSGDSHRISLNNSSNIVRFRIRCSFGEIGENITNGISSPCKCNQWFDSWLSISVFLNIVISFANYHILIALYV